MGKVLLKDSSGHKSVTVTAFILGFIVVNIKLLLSGAVVAGYEFAEFSGIDYGAALGALGAIYVMRRATNGKQKTDGES